MLPTSKKSVMLLICLIALAPLAGCTDWKKKYNSLNVEFENVKGQLEYERAQKGQLEEQVAQGQMTIAELERQIAENRSAAQASGFEGFDVAFDAKAGTVTVTLPNTLLFNSGKAALKKSTISELDHIQSVLSSQYAGRQIDIVGHTDSDPIKKSKWKDNWELSAQRALSVVRYLVKKGISSDQIREVGCGSARPVASNATATGKASNRRVEIVVHMR